MTDADKAALASAIDAALERQIRAMQVPFYWRDSRINGDDRQYAERDLALAKAERLAQKGRD